MTSRADIDRLSKSTNSVVDMAKRDVRKLFRRLDGQPLSEVEASLVESVPSLVREYGDLAASVTEEWYMELREREVGDRFHGSLGGRASEDAVIGSTRYAARNLPDSGIAEALGSLSGAVQRHVKYSSRDTVRRLVGQDRSKPRFGRVPSGTGKTCAWCEMLASRGFVYLTEETAGIAKDHYHDDCGCEVVPEWESEHAHIKGYDPDAMYDRYQAARAKVEARGEELTDQTISKQLRRDHPRLYRDGVFPKS